MQKNLRNKKQGRLFQKAANKIRKAVGEAIRKVADIISPQEVSSDIIQPEQEVSRLTKEPDVIQTEQVTFDDIRKRTTQQELDRLKESGKSVISLANKRWKEIESAGLESFAIQRALDETNGVKYFDIESAETIEDAKEEIIRAQVFIKDFTSSIQGAKNFTRELKFMQYYGKFGNEWRTNDNDEAYDISTIKPELAKVAFSLYRRLEKNRGIQMQSYGSGRVIAMLYDMVEDSNTTDINNESDMTDLINNAINRLDETLGKDFDIAYYRWEQQNDMVDSIVYSTGLESNF